MPANLGTEAPIILGSSEIIPSCPSMSHDAPFTRPDIPVFASLKRLCLRCSYLPDLVFGCMDTIGGKLEPRPCLPKGACVHAAQLAGYELFHDWAQGRVEQKCSTTTTLKEPPLEKHRQRSGDQQEEEPHP